MRKIIILLAVAAFIISSCSGNRATGQPTAQDTPAASATPTNPPTATITASPLPPSSTPEPSVTPTPIPPSYVTFALTQQTFCRMGPDIHYKRVVTLAMDKSVQVYGRNEDSSWLLVHTVPPDRVNTCWLPITSMEKFGDTNGLKVTEAPPLPDAPLRVSATEGACGTHALRPVTVIWSPYAQGTGYYVFRNGVNIANVYDDTYIDHDTPNSSKAYTYTYVIQAFNAVGVSKNQVSVSVTLCGSAK